MKLAHIIPLVFLATAVYAAPQSFDFKDPKGVNNAVFKLDAPLESINGSASGISEKEHLHSANWLDVAKYPEITFEAKSLANVKTDAGVTTADATGTFTLHGVSKEITVPIKLTYLKDKLGSRVPNLKGDLLVIRANFNINREDFNIQKGQYEDKVSTTIDLSLSIAGAFVAK
ncbi:MAG: YceI family protein [Verrucomicrobia bacterium]|nr:YceI family protein [Verrucomicrobiota bacterium]